MSAPRMRVLMIALFVAAAALTVISGENGLLSALAAACFFAGVMVFFRWRAKLRASVFDRGEKTSD